MVWDLLLPGSTPAQRERVLVILRLECVTRMLRSDVFWTLILDRQFMTKLSEALHGKSRAAAALSLLSDPRVARLFASLGLVEEAIGHLQADLQVLQRHFFWFFFCVCF